MSDNKHSPGTWRFNASGGEILSDQPAYSGDRSNENYHGFVIAETVLNRNGSLIAAAPDMYALLVEMHVYCCAMQDGFGTCMVCNVIKKAEANNGH